MCKHEEFNIPETHEGGATFFIEPGEGESLDISTNIHLPPDGVFPMGLHLIREGVRMVQAGDWSGLETGMTPEVREELIAIYSACNAVLKESVEPFIRLMESMAEALAEDSELHDKAD